jgi:hypothetical protein
MRPRERRDSGGQDLFRARLDQIIEDLTLRCAPPTAPLSGPPPPHLAGHNQPSDSNQNWIKVRGTVSAVSLIEMTTTTKLDKLAAAGSS